MCEVIDLNKIYRGDFTQTLHPILNSVKIFLSSTHKGEIN